MSDQDAPALGAAADPPPAASEAAGAAHPPGSAAGAGTPHEGAEAAATIADLQARVAELEDRWRQALADLDNLRKRVARDLERQRAEERARVAAEWLPVVDNLERALEHSAADPNAIIDGVRAVRDQAVAVLDRLGFPRRDGLGEPFDPARHQAVSTLAGANAPEGTVVGVVRPGYGDGEHQLRPAGVVVATRAH